MGDAPALRKGPLDRLALQMQQGDEGAAGALYGQLIKKVFGFCMSRVRDRTRAEDLTQEIFLKLVSGIGSFDPARGPFVTWFWQLARNTLTDHFRHRRDIAFTDAEEGLVEAAAVERPASRLEAMVEHGELQVLLRSFSEEEQQLFQLRFLADLSYRDMAAILGRPEGALRVATTRLKKKIRTAFGYKHA